MNIELKNISFNLNKIEHNKIVFIKVIERLPDGEILIDLNGEKLKARVEKEIPDSFFAYVDKKIENNVLKLNLRIIESFKNIKESISTKSELEIIKNFILLNSLPFIEDNISLSIIMLKKNIPLNIQNFEILKYSLRKYGKIPAFIIDILHKGKKIDKNFIDLIFNIKDIIKNIEKENLSGNEIENIANLINALSDYSFNFNIKILKDNNKKIIFLTKIENDEEKKRYYFDLSSEEIKKFAIIIDITKEELYTKVFLEKEIIATFNIEIENQESIFIDKLKKIYPDKKISLKFFEYISNYIFENEFSSENKNNTVGNLDILV